MSFIYHGKHEMIELEVYFLYTLHILKLFYISVVQPTCFDLAFRNYRI